MTQQHDDLAALLAEPAFVSYGFRLLAAGSGTARLAIPAIPTNRRPGGIIAGSVIMAAGDVAVWLAIKTLLGLDDASVTVDFHAAFTSAATGDLEVEATVRHCGGRMIVATLRASQGERVVAVGTATYARIMPR